MYYDKNTILFLNGNWEKAADAKGDLYSQTLHYGNGVFEGIRSYETPGGAQIFKAKDHFKRLHNSARRMNIELPYSVEDLIDISYQLLKKNNQTNAYIRPLVYKGTHMALTPTSKINVMIATWEWPQYLGGERVKVMISSYQRPNPKSIPIDAKITGTYANSILATEEAKDKGFDEALLLDSDGFVAEGSGENFFLEKNGTIYTPPLGNILPGITRATVFEMAEKLGYPVIEKQILPEEINDADAAFFTGTATEIAGIASIGGIEFSMPWEETMGYSLFLAYRNRVTQNEFRDFTLV